MGNRISTEDLYKITQSLADRAVSDVKKRREDERKREEAIKKNREERLAAAAEQNRIPNYKGGSLWDQYKAALASGEAKNASDFITKRDTRNAAWNKVGAETLNDDMEALAKSISSTYGTQFDPSKYYSQETINGSSDQVKKMRDRLNALAEYYNTYGGSDEQKKAVGEQIKAYDSELKFLNDLGAHYGQYSSPEAYETLYDNGLYTEKYQGKNYSDIQNALKSTTNDREKAWLEKNADSFMTAAEAQAEIDRIEKAMGTKNIAGQRWTTGLPKIENGKLVYNDNLYDEETGKRLQKLEAIRDSKINKETLEGYGKYLGEANEFAAERALFLAKQNNILQHGNETFGVFAPDAKAPYAKNENAQNEASRLSPEKLKAVNEQSGQAFSFLENADWATDDEKKIYDYLLYYKGGDEAKKYLRALSYELNKRAANALDQTVSDMYDKASGLGKTVLNIGSLGMNIIGNPEAAIDTIAHRIVGERVDPNSNNQTFRRIRNVIREKTGADLAKASEGTIFGKELFGENAANMLYGAAMSSLDSLLGGFTFGEGYTAVMGGGAMADEAERLYNKGASDSQIFNRSFAAGLAEYITEKVSMDNLLKAKSPANGWQVAKEILKQAGIEGSEEMASDVLNLVADSLIMADRSEMSESIQKYKDGYIDDNGTYHKGVSEKEAQKLAWQDFFTDAMADGLAGALSGGMMSVGPTISSYKYSKNRAAIQIPSIDPGNAEGLVSNARINDISVLTDVSEALKNGDAEEAGGVISEGIAWYEFLKKYGEKTYGKNQWSEVQKNIDDSISKLKKIQKLVADGSIDAAAIDEVLKTAETSMKTTPTVDMTSANDEKLFSLLAKGEPSNSVIEKNILKDRGTLAAFERLTGLRIGGTTVSQKRADVREAFKAVSSSTETLKAAQNAIESGATATEGHKNAAVIIDQAIQANRAENSRLRNSEKVKSAETKAAIDATNRQHRFLETVRNYVINGGDLSGFTESPVADVSAEGGTNSSETKTTQEAAKKRVRADFSAYQNEKYSAENASALANLNSKAEQDAFFRNENAGIEQEIKNIESSDSITAEEKAQRIGELKEAASRNNSLAKAMDDFREMGRLVRAGEVDKIVDSLRKPLKKMGVNIEVVDNVEAADGMKSGAYFDKSTNTIKVSRDWNGVENVVKLELAADGNGFVLNSGKGVSFDRAVTQTIAHEIAHADSGLTLDFIKAVAGTQYDAFDLKGRLEHPDDRSWKSEDAQKEENWRRYVDAYTEQAMLEMKGTEEQRRASAEKAVNDAYIFEEIMADMFGAAVDDMGHSSRAGENIFWAMNRNKPGIIKRIVDALKRVIAKIDDLIHKDKGAYLAVEQRQAAERLRDMLTGELKRAYGTDVKGEAAVESDGGKRYSISKSFVKNYDAWDKQSVGGYFKLGTTSAALESVGINPANIYWYKSKIKEIKAKHPEMTDAVIKQVPELLENPIIIMQSQTVTNRATVLGDLDAGGKPVLCALELKPDGNISNFIVIASAYPKSAVQNLINTSDILYVDPNKNRTDSWLSSRGLQLPEGVTNYGSIGSISYTDKNVKGQIVFGEEKNAKTAMQEALEKAGVTKEGKRFSLASSADTVAELQREETELTNRIREIEKSDAFKKANDDLSKAINSDNIAEGMKAYQAWRKESGYADLVDRRDALRADIEEKSKGSSGRASAGELAAIEKSGLSEADYFRKQAVKEFGYTPYFYDAGYITPNGKMLNFSGEKGQHYGSRGEDHRAIAAIYENTEGTDALVRFMNDGNIRIMAETPGLDISASTEPSKEQYTTIRRFANEYADGGYFAVDLSDGNGKTVGTLEYEGNINPTRIVNDIKHFYETGEVREQSGLDRFRYSLTRANDEYMKAVESGNVEEQQRLVDEAAENAGYDTVLYHGTQSFGFTQIDVSKYSDDEVSFFATSNPEMAQTYSAKSGTREISRKGGIENLSLPQVVDRLNAVSAADTSDYDRYTYRIMNRSDTEALKKSIQSGIKELRAETERLVSEYADRLAKDFNGEDELKHSRLRSLLNALDSDSASKLSANLYTVLNHNEIFDDAAKVKFGNLEADIRLLKKLAALKTDEDVVVREDTDRYDIVVEDQEKARKRLEKLDNSGNYVLRGRTEGFLEIDGNGHNWNDIFTTLEPKGGNTLKAEYDFGSESLKLSDRDGEFAVIPAKSVADAVSPMARAFARRYGTTFATTVLAQAKDQLKNSATAEVKIKSTGKTNTRDIANFAREQGYPGVKITDIYDNGGRGSEAGRGDVYIFFNPEQDVKSADPITYDDSGNVIPLTERFDSGNRDIRWSLAGNSGITTEITDDSYDEYEGGYQRRDIKLNGETVGTVAIRIYDDYSEIDRIDIDEKYRNKGIGTAVLGDIAGEFDTTYIVPDNENAKRLYERIGEEVTSGEVYENLDQGYGVYQLDKSYGNTRWSLAGKYDYSKSFADQIDDYKNGLLPVRDTFVVSETPKVWRDIGFNALPVTLNQTHVDYALNGTRDADHEVSEADLKKLPEKIKEPIAIIQSQSNPSRAVVLIEMTSKSGKNIVVPVEVDGYGKTNNLRIDSNALTSVFGKKNAANQLQAAIDNTVNGKTELFYWDKKRSLALLQGAGLQLPRGLPQDGFVHSIREPGSFVKAKMDNVTNSLQFKRWFGDWNGGKRNVSKVVNRDGSPRVVYHYTDADFEAFDTSKSGSNQGATLGDGIYVSTNPTEFSYAGKNRLELYASIKNPFEKQLTKSQAERIYDKYFAPYHDDKYNTYRPHVIKQLQSRLSVFNYLSEAADNGKVRTSDILKELGYDGVHDGSEWVAFDSTQLKSATDNIGTFDKDNPKFRYSLAKSTQSELKALQKENEKLRQDVDDLKQELQLTHGRKLSRDALISSIQKILIDGYGVKLSAKELYPDVTNLYDMFYNNTVDGKRLKKGESVDTMRIIEEMDKIVDAVIENAVGVDDTYVEMKKLLPELRKTKLVVPMDARADAAQSAGFENWAEFRKANFGRVGFANEGLPVDTYYMELSERYPELFPDGITNPGEQAAHIADVVNTIRESGITEYQLYDIEDERIRASIKNDVMDIIGNAEKLQTFADRAAQKVEDTKLAEAMHYGADIAKLKRLNAGKVAGIKAENRKRLSDMRRKYQDRVESVRERYAEARQNRSEKQKQTVLRNKILRKYTEASTMLDRPTTENHFTEAMRKPLMEFLAAVDITTGKSVAKQGVYDRILRVIEAANNATAEDGKNGLDIAETDLNVQEKQLIVDSGLLERMSAWVEANQGKKLTELSSAQLEELNGIFNQLKHLTAEIKRLYDPREGLAAKSWQAQKEIGLAQTKEREQVLGAKTERARGMYEQVHFGALDPSGYYNTLGSDTMTAQFERFRRCQNRFSENIQMFTDRLGEIVDGAIPKDEHGKNAKEVTLKLSHGTLTATPAQLMSIHLMLNQEDSRRCLFNEAGGVIIGKFTAEKPKDGKAHIAGKRTFAQSGRLVLNEADAAKITAALTDGQRKRADAISALLNNEAARLGNEVSMAMYGYKKYTTENYFPMRTADDYRAIADNPNYEMNLLGLSFTKERTGRAGKALAAEDIYDVIGRHLTNMAQYNAFAQELDNAKKMYFLRLGDGTSLKQRIIRSYGREADTFYNKLINNLSGVQMYTNNSAEALSDKLLSNYKAAAVAGNVSVVLKQPMSIFRALPEFSLAGLKKSMAFEDILNLSPKQLKANTAEMLKYSGIARLKAWGSSENMTRKSFESLYNDNSDTTRQKINEFLTSGAENADMWTWAKLWRMSKAEIDAQNKYTKGSREYFEAVDRKFSDVIGKTQVVQSALDSSMAVQNAKGFGKFLFAFQNEPLKQYSYLISTLNDARRGKPGAKKKLAKVIASSLANTAAVSAISTFMAWLRGTLDRDDDDELLDDLMKEFAGNSIDDLLSGAFAPVWQYIDTIMGAINSGVYGNTVERLDMAALSDLGGLINKYFISQNGGRPNLGTVQDIVNVASNLFGLPAKNIFRDVKSVIDRIILELPVPSAAKYNYLKAWKDVELTNKAAVTEAYYDVLRDAVDRGRYSDYVKIKRDMIYHGYTETKIKNAVMKSSLMDDLYELKKVNPGSYKAKVNSIVSSVSAVSSLEGKEFEDFIESAMKRREREDGGSKTDDEVYDEMHKKMEKEVKEQLIYIDVSKRAAYIKKMLKTYGEYGITEADILKVLRKAGKA